MSPAAKEGTCTLLHLIPYLQPTSYYWAPSKRRWGKIHCLNPWISGNPPQTIIPSTVRTLTEWRRTPDLLEQIGGIIVMKVRPITELYCVTSISTVTPALDHRQQCPFLFSPTELFGRERRIRRPPAGMKWGGRGWNIFAWFFLVGQVEFYSRCVIVEGSGTGIKYIVTLKFCTRGHQLFYYPGSFIRPCPIVWRPYPL